MVFLIIKSEKISIIIKLQKDLDLVEVTLKIMLFKTTSKTIQLMNIFIIIKLLVTSKITQWDMTSKEIT
jgi:hypothetical protein